MEAGSGAEGWGGVLQAVFTAPHMPLPVGVAGGRTAGPKRGPSPEARGESWRCSLAPCHSRTDPDGGVRSDTP